MTVRSSRMPRLELVLGWVAGDHGADKAVEVGTRREVAASAGDDADEQLVVAVELVPGVGQPTQHLGVDGVALVGTVQSDGEDGAIALQEHCRI